MNKNNFARERERKRVRLWDWLAVGAAFLLFLSAAGFYFYTKRPPVKEERITGVLLISGVEGAAWEGDAAPVRAGDLLRYQNGTIVMGEIEEITLKPHLYATVLEETPSWEVHPYLLDVEVSVRMQVREKAGDGLRVGDLRVVAGSTGEYRFGRYLSRAEMVEVRREA